MEPCQGSTGGASFCPGCAARPWALRCNPFGVIAIWALLTVGCVPSAFVADAAKTPAPLPTTPAVVKLGARTHGLGEAQRAAVARDEFVARVGELLAAQRPAPARRYIERYPDVALDALRCCTAAQAKQGAIQFIAQVHDEQCGAADAAGGWQTLTADRSAQPGRHAVYEAARPKLVELLKANKAQDALAMKLPEPAALPLQLDAAELRADALLQAEKPAEAEAVLTQALARAAAQPYPALKLKLLLGEAQLRAGKAEAAGATWQQTVEAASERLLCDPIFWERASYVRPVEVPWPEVVAQRLADYQASGGRKPPEGQVAAEGSPSLRGLTPPARRDAGQREALVWGGIGRMRLDRHEGQAALLAYKRAESLTVDPQIKAPMQLGQARALLQLNQLPSAAAILVRLATVSDADVALPALAMLGAVKLQKGSVEHSIALLQKAVAADWPGRSDAEADLGLAYLSLGDDANGFRWLHSAQQKFEAAKDHAALAQCLTNEMNYLNHKKKPEEAEKVRLRLESCP